MTLSWNLSPIRAVYIEMHGSCSTNDGTAVGQQRWEFSGAWPKVKPLSHQGGVLTATARRARKTQNAEVRAVRPPRAPSDRHGIAVASPLDAVGSPRTPCHGAHFVHATAIWMSAVWMQWVRSGSAVTVQWGLLGRHEDAVCTQWGCIWSPQECRHILQ